VKVKFRLNVKSRLKYYFNFFIFLLKGILVNFLLVWVGEEVMEVQEEAILHPLSFILYPLAYKLHPTNPVYLPILISPSQFFFFFVIAHSSPTSLSN